MRAIPAIVLALSTSLTAQDVNLAPAGVATRSPASGSGTVSSINDGNRDGYWYNGSCAHTDGSLGAWLQVTLASASIVNEIVLWNRGDCCSARLSNFRVDVTNGAAVVFTQNILTTGGVVPAGDSIRIKIPGVGVTATAVRLTNLGPNSEGSYYLQICEMEILRHGLGRNVNFARYGTATASTNPSQASRVIDGQTNGIAGSSVFVSASGAGQWLQVAMERHRVDEIRLWPATHGAGSCGNFRVDVVDGGVSVWSQNVLAGVLMPIDLPTVVTPPSGLLGDTIRITTLGPVGGNEDIVLAEVESLQFAGYIGEQWAYGAGCLGAAGLPKLTCALRPATGANLVLRVDAVPAPGIGLLLTGISDSSLSGLPLPLNLQAAGAPGCWALTSLELSQVGLATAGVIDFPFPLPPTALLGLRMFQQAALIDPATNALNVVVSNALEQFVGF